MTLIQLLLKLKQESLMIPQEVKIHSPYPSLMCRDHYLQAEECKHCGVVIVTDKPLQQTIVICRAAVKRSLIKRTTRPAADVYLFDHIQWDPLTCF